MGRSTVIAAAQMDHTGYTTVEDYVRAQHEVFFGESVDADINSADWRVALARRLREHLTFVNLLRVLEGRPKPLSKIPERLRPSLPVASDREAAGVLNGLCALISVASRQDDDAKKLRPFLRVGLHLWVRELRRMVCRLGCPLGLPRLLRPGFQATGSPRVPAGYHYDSNLRIASAGLSPASTAASLAAPLGRALARAPVGGGFPAPPFRLRGGFTVPP